MVHQTLKTTVLDHSLNYRTIIAGLVENHKDLDLVAKYGNAMDTYIATKTKEVDLIFLDVEMPLISGFDLITSLKDSIQVILVTQNPDHALKAFDYGVTDFLLKPIGTNRFSSSVKRAMIKHNQMHPTKDNREYLIVKSDQENKKIELEDLNWIEAMGDYVKLVCDEDSTLVHSTMKSLSTQLPKNRFIRIHRSYIVNLSKVEKFCSSNVEIAGAQLPVSRTRKLYLDKLLSV